MKLYKCIDKIFRRQKARSASFEIQIVRFAAGYLNVNRLIFVFEYMKPEMKYPAKYPWKGKTKLVLHQSM